MSDMIAYGLAGFDRIHALAEHRAVAGRCTVEQAFSRLTHADVRQAVADSMPPAARAAFLAGPRRGDRPPLYRTTPAPLRAVASTERTHDMTTNLTPTETTAARAVFAQMAAPLNAGELAVCAALGIPEADYRAQRDEDLGKSLPGAVLTADERVMASSLGLSAADIIKAR